MTHVTRREFVETAGKMAVGVAVSTPLLSTLAAGATEAKQPIKVGQIGTAHAHASGKMATLRKLSADFEVVGVVEPDAELRRECEGDSAYRGLRWMTEEELLSSKGLQAVPWRRRLRIWSRLPPDVSRPECTFTWTNRPVSRSRRSRGSWTRPLAAD